MKNTASMEEMISELYIEGQKLLLPRCGGITIVPPSLFCSRSEDSPIPDPSGSSCSLWAWEGVRGREENWRIGRGLEILVEMGAPPMSSHQRPLWVHLFPDHSLSFNPEDSGVGPFITTN